MKKFSRKIAAAAALAITVSSCMTGCFNNTGSGSGSGSSGGNSETVLRVGYTQEQSSFDPADFTIVAATLTGYDCYDTSHMTAQKLNLPLQNLGSRLTILHTHTR